MILSRDKTEYQSWYIRALSAKWESWGQAANIQESEIRALSFLRPGSGVLLSLRVLIMSQRWSLIIVHCIRSLSTQDKMISMCYIESSLSLHSSICRLWFYFHFGTKLRKQSSGSVLLFWQFSCEVRHWRNVQIWSWDVESEPTSFLLPFNDFFR